MIRLVGRWRRTQVPWSRCVADGYVFRLPWTERQRKEKRPSSSLSTGQSRNIFGYKRVCTIELVWGHHRSRSLAYVSEHFRLNPGDVESYLNRHRLKYRCTSQHAIVEHCPFCPPTKGKTDNLYKLYILRDSGVYFCHRCDAKGSWFDLRKQVSFEDESVSPMRPKENPARHGSKQFAVGTRTRKVVAPKSGSQADYTRNLWGRGISPVKRYLNEERRITDDVLSKYGVGSGNFDIIVNRDVREKQPCMTFPMYDGDGNLVRHKIRSITTKTGMRLLPKGGGWGLFGLNTVPSDATSVVLTEGELDAMSVYQATGRPAISLPNGASSLPLDLLPFLERFKRVYLWMDEDERGQAGAQQFSRKLGLRRCLSVRGVFADGQPCKDANEGLQRELDLDALVKKAAVIPHSGLLTFQDLRKMVYADMTSHNDPNTVRCQSLPRLHELLKGHRPGELTIFSGQTGVGKTTFLSQLSLDYCTQGVATLWGSFELGNVRLAGKMLAQFHAVYTDGSTLLDKFDLWADRFSELPMYFMKYHGSNPVERIVDAMEYANYVYDCRHVVLDNLQFMSYGQGQGARSERFDVMDNAVAQIRQFCTSKNAHVSLVVHPRKTDDSERIQTASVYGSAKATQEADNVLLLQKTAEGRQLEVTKNRFDGSLGAVNLKFDTKRLLFSQTDSAGAWHGWVEGDSMFQQEEKGKKECAQEKADSRVTGRSIDCISSEGHEARAVEEGVRPSGNIMAGGEMDTGGKWDRGEGEESEGSKGVAEEECQQARIGSGRVRSTKSRRKVRRKQAKSERMVADDGQGWGSKERGRC